MARIDSLLDPRTVYDFYNRSQRLNADWVQKFLDAEVKYRDWEWECQDKGYDAVHFRAKYNAFDSGKKWGEGPFYGATATYLAPLYPMGTVLDNQERIVNQAWELVKHRARHEASEWFKIYGTAPFHDHTSLRYKLEAAEAHEVDLENQRPPRHLNDLRGAETALKAISYKDWQFKVRLHPSSGDLLLNAEWESEDSREAIGRAIHDEAGTMHSRTWIFPLGGATVDELYRTAYALVNLAEEHEAAEFFTWRDIAVFNHHIGTDWLIEARYHEQENMKDVFPYNLVLNA